MLDSYLRKDETLGFEDILNKPSDRLDNVPLGVHEPIEKAFKM
jgi:hypothetical protein